MVHTMRGSVWRTVTSDKELGKDEITGLGPKEAEAGC